jgi:hypothetical protein
VRDPLATISSRRRTQRQSIRIEMFGDLHEYGALGRVVTKSEALAAV